MAARKPAAKTASAPVVTEQADAATEAAPGQFTPVMSAGVASDLDMLGWAMDPASGGRWERDPETGKTTHTSRTGEVTEI